MTENKGWEKLERREVWVVKEDVKEVQTSYKLPTEVKNYATNHEEKNEKTNRPAVVLAEDVLDSLCQGEGLAGAVGPNDEDWGQGNRDGCGDGQDGLFLLGIQTRIQLLVPLPVGIGKMRK